MKAAIVFYGICASVGLLFSIVSWKESRRKPLNIALLFLIPGVFFTLGLLMIYTYGDKNFDGISDFRPYFDPANFLPGEKRHARNSMAVLFPLWSYFFFLLFDAVWRLKNWTLKN